MYKRFAALAASGALSLALAAPSEALNDAQARSKAYNYIVSRCGNFFYACSGAGLSVILPTGVDQAGQPQYIFSGWGVEVKKRPLPLAPQLRKCNITGGLSPWGRIISGQKKCKAIVPATNDTKK